MQDNTSLTLCGTTYIFGTVSAFTLNTAMGIVTIIAGLTTVLYNIVKIRKELKK